MIRGVVLAAGASTRMGRPKAGLPMGRDGLTVLVRTVRTLLDADVADVVVVAGAHPEAVRAAWRGDDPRVRIVDHPDWSRGQLSSMLAGLAAIDNPALDAMLMTLVDVPLVSVDTVRLVLQAWRDTRAPIVRPARGEEHGHPVIFDRAVFAALRDADPNVGAKAVVRACASQIVNVHVTDEGAFLDLDTPEDYERLASMAALIDARRS